MVMEYTQDDESVGRLSGIALSPERLAQIEQTKLDFANYTPETHDEWIARRSRFYEPGSPELKRFLRVNYRAPSGGLRGAVGFVAPAVLAAAGGPMLSKAFGGGMLGNMGAGAVLGGTKARIRGGNILTGALTGGAIAGIGTGLSDYFSAPTDTVNPLNQTYRDELLSGMYDGAAPAQTLSDSSGNLFNLSNSGANPYSPMLGGGGGETFPTNLAPTFGSPTPIDPLYSGNYVDPSLTAPWTNNTSAGLPGQMLTGAAPLGQFTLPEPITYGPTPGAPVFPNGVDSIANAASSPTGYVDPYSSGSITGTSVAEGAMTPASLGALGAGATGLGIASAGAAATGGAGLTGIAAALAAAGLSPEIAQSIADGLGSASPYAGLLSAGLQLGGGYLAGKSAVDAAQTSSDAQIKAAQIAADAAKFRPVGITTNFGSSNFTKDAQGNVTGAGYTLSPEMLAQQAKLMGVSEQALQQYLGAQGATAPMGDAAQRMMTLGNSYLATTPQEQAAKYMADQQALLATGRERYVNNMLTGEYNRGTYGLSVGGTSTGMNAANPRLEAMFNAQRQQDLGLAAQATQGGMNYAKFGGAMTGLGGSMLRDMYGTQTAAYDPYKAALGGATQVEGLGQNALTLGMDMGSTVTAANARSGSLLANGMTNAATTMQPANAYSPWGAMLSGAGTQLQNYGAPQQTPMFNPYTGVRL